MYDPALGRFHTQDAFAEKYLNFSPYQYAANNPILFIDVNGDSTYTYNWETGVLTMIDDTGGDEFQTVNFVDGEGKAIMIGDKTLTSHIDGETAYVTETREGTLVSGYDPLEGLSEDYNSNSGYEYTATDLTVRHKLQGTRLGEIIGAQEASGNAQPLARDTYYDDYVNKWGTNSAFWHGIEGGYFSSAMPGSTNLSVNRPGIRANYNSRVNFNRSRISSSSGTGNNWNSRTPTFNEFRRSTRGLFKGYKGRGTSTRAQWEAYKQLYK